MIGGQCVRENSFSRSPVERSARESSPGGRISVAQRFSAGRTLRNGLLRPKRVDSDRHENRGDAVPSEDRDLSPGGTTRFSRRFLRHSRFYVTTDILTVPRRRNDLPDTQSGIFRIALLSQSGIHGGGDGESQAFRRGLSRIGCKRPARARQAKGADEAARQPPPRPIRHRSVPGRWPRLAEPDERGAESGGSSPARLTTRRSTWKRG